MIVHAYNRVSLVLAGLECNSLHKVTTPLVVLLSVCVHICCK